MEIALFIFDKMTPLDAVGPLEVIGRVPGADVKIVGKTAGRTSPADITLFKSLGLAVEDLASAQHILRKAAVVGMATVALGGTRHS